MTIYTPIQADQAVAAKHRRDAESLASTWLLQYDGVEPFTVEARTYRGRINHPHSLAEIERTASVLGERGWTASIKFNRHVHLARQAFVLPAIAVLFASMYIYGLFGGGLYLALGSVAFGMAAYLGVQTFGQKPDVLIEISRTTNTGAGGGDQNQD
ncbi:MAG: hypothetical protein IAF58_13720 [Leptolyngbya sp.]|nr:hypothetical protein [Candidatus Melainabacteria bacterium]